MAEEIKDATSEVAPDASPDASPAPKKKKNKAKIIGIVVGVIVVLGIGLFVWHEQPSFCNAICHTPMDAYGDTYLKGNVDKYGNELNETEAQAMMAVYHKDKAGYTCMKCHLPVLGQQVNEGLHWITGNYTIEGHNQLGQALLEERSLNELAEGIGLKSGEEFCLRSGCHVNDDGSVMTRDDLLAKTADLDKKFNPHNTEQHGEKACGECHKGHSQSVNACTQCHAEAPVPDGWLTDQQARKKAVVS